MFLKNFFFSIMFSSHFYCLIPFDKISKFPCLHIDLNSSLTLLYQAVRLWQLDNGFHIYFEIGYKSLLIFFFYNLKKKSDKGHVLCLLKNTHLNSNNTVFQKIKIPNLSLKFLHEKFMYNSYLTHKLKIFTQQRNSHFKSSILTTTFSLHYNNL